MIHAYPHKRQRRITPEEIRRWARQEHGVELLQGFGKIIEASSTGYVENRVSSFLEFGNARAWYLSLSSGGALSWETEAVPGEVKTKDILFIFAMGLGNGAVCPQPTGQFDLYCNDKLIVSFKVVKHSQTWRSSEGSFHFSANRIESAVSNASIRLDDFLTNESFASFGIGLLRMPANTLPPGKPAVLKVVPVSDVESKRWFQLASVENCIDRTNLFPAILSLCGRTQPKAFGYNVYFGDIHTHSGVSHSKPLGCGVGTREDNYHYAMGPGALDIYALTDHEWQITREGIKDYFTLADKFNHEGHFVTLPAYEHSNPLYGHRNVYFRDSKGTVIPAHRDWKNEYWNTKTVISPEELWQGLEKCGVEAITIPHHPSATSHPLTWDFYNPRFDRLAEIYSVWGSSEYYGDYPRGVSDRFRGLYVRDALNRGYRLGLICSSDGHDGHPGNAQSPLIKHHHTFHPLGSGWIGVLSEKLAREDIFEAMYARRCYGTTGVPIVLDFTVNGQVMGSELPHFKQGEKPVLHIACHGSNGINHVRIIKNGHVVETIPCHGEWDCAIKWVDNNFDYTRPNYYYVRVVQVDYESAWSSPVWIG